MARVAVRKVVCLTCPEWVPALDYFGKPTGRGGCANSHYNLLGYKPRVCKKEESWRNRN